MLNWNATRREMGQVVKIIDRIQKEGHQVDRSTLVMDLETVHCNGCRLRLGDMVGGRISDIMHDVNGISKHLDRKTGQLKKGFAPRFAA
jgi:hypothetical protein